MLLTSLFTLNSKPGAVVSRCDEPEEKTDLAKLPFDDDEPIK
jgi:hypothetical protein